MTTNYRAEKYKVTNKKMMNVIKNEIKVNIQKTMLKLEEMEENLKLLDSEGEPSNEQLAYLYNMRRVMKDEIGKKVT